MKINVSVIRDHSLVWRFLNCQSKTCTHSDTSQLIFARTVILVERRSHQPSQQVAVAAVTDWLVLCSPNQYGYCKTKLNVTKFGQTSR